MPRLLLALRRAFIPLTLALAAGLPLAPAAQAGEYRVFACRTPTGIGIPLGDWVMERNEVGPGVNLCAEQGFAYFIVGPPQTGVGYWSGVGITLPEGITATSLRGNRWARMHPGAAGDIGATPTYQLRWGRASRWFEPGTNVLDECRFAFGCTNIDAAWDTPVPTKGNIAVDFPGGAKFIGFAVACVQQGPPDGACMAGESGRGHLRINGLDLTIQDDTAPTATAASGTILQSGPRAGTQSLTFAASDVGAGVFQAIAQVDGKEIGRIRPDPSPTCADAGSLPEMELEFLRVQPCQRSLGVAFDIDTTKLSNGPHRLSALVRDASGNLSNALSYDVTIANTTPPTAGGGDTAGTATGPNGSGGDPSTGTLGFKKAPRNVKAKYGRKQTVTGTLADGKGTPIAGATVDVSERVQLPSATWTKVGSVTTDAKGKYRFQPATGASRRLRFSYSATRGSTDYRSTREVLVSVSAGMTIAAKPRTVARRGLVRLSGKVRIDALPKGAWIEVQVRRVGGWQTVSSRRTDRNGRWTFAHRLQRAANTTLAFRARLRPASDIASAESTSSAVRVRVR